MVSFTYCKVFKLTLILHLQWRHCKPDFNLAGLYDTYDSYCIVKTGPYLKFVED